MKYRMSLACLAAVVLLTMSSHAQGRPDFTGTWVMDAPRSESAHQVEPIGPVTLLVTHGAKAITIETRRGADSQTLVYNLDGSRHVTRVGDATATSSMRWDGDRLITETIYEIKGFPVTNVQIRTLNAAGSEMEVVNTVRVEHGYQWTGTNRVLAPPNYASGKDVFVKQR